MTVREQARHDFARLAAIGYVVRDDLRPEAIRAWRHAITGHGHRAGLRVDSGTVGHRVWASANLTSAPDMRR